MLAANNQLLHNSLTKENHNTLLQIAAAVTVTSE